MSKQDCYYDKSKGLYRKQVTINGKRKMFSGKTRQSVMLKIMSYKEETNTLPTLEDVADGWKEKHWEEVREGTLRSYSAPLKRIIDRFGEYPIDTITSKDIQAFYNKLSESYSSKTVHQHKIIFGLIYKYAQFDLGLDIENQSERTTLPSGMRKSTRNALGDKEKAIVSSVKNSENFILPYLLYYTGTRCGEALALQMQDVDFANKKITIYKQVTHHGNQPVISDPKTQNAFRSVPLLPSLENRLKKENLKPTDYISSGCSIPLTKSALDKRWKKWCKTYGLIDPEGKPTIDRHSIRHQYATTLYEAGIEPKSAQHLLGHADIKTTLDIYTHISQEQFDKDFQALSSYMEKDN